MSLFQPPQRPTPRSRALIAQSPKGNVGCVLYWSPGSQLADEIDEAGTTELGWLGLDDAPEGLSVWEGTYRWAPGSWETPQDGQYEPRGAFREPTAEEWAAIQARKNPFPDERTQEQLALEDLQDQETIIDATDPNQEDEEDRIPRAGEGPISDGTPQAGLAALLDEEQGSGPVCSGEARSTRTQQDSNSRDR